MKNSDLEKFTFFEVRLTALNPHQRIATASVYVFVSPEQAAQCIDLVSFLDDSLSRSLGCFSTFFSVLSLDIRAVDPSSFVGPAVPFKGRDTFQIVNNLASDILRHLFSHE